MVGSARDFETCEACEKLVTTTLTASGVVACG
jgi:hypothetical protein